MTCLLKPGSYRATRGHCAHSRKVAIRQLRRNLRRLQRAPPCGRVKNASLILDMHTLQRQMNTHKLFTQRQSWCAEHQIKEATPSPGCLIFSRTLVAFFSGWPHLFTRDKYNGFHGGRPVNLHFCPPYIAIVIMDISLAEAERRHLIELRLCVQLLASIGWWNVFRRQRHPHGAAVIKIKNKGTDRSVTRSEYNTGWV
jgi:hypothetical protein